MGCTGPGARGVRDAWGIQVLEQGMCGVPGVHRSWSKGCEGYLGCIGPGARVVRGAWDAQGYTSYTGPGPRGVGYLGCTGPGARGVRCT